jgi:hypothetical protein
MKERKFVILPVSGQHAKIIGLHHRRLELVVILGDPNDRRGGGEHKHVLSSCAKKWFKKIL